MDESYDSRGLFPNLQILTTIIITVGSIFTAKFLVVTVYSLIIGFRAHVWSKLWDRKLVERYGKWAVVTGCTDGIGKGYAFELAKHGMNLVLISRTLEKLHKVSKDICSQFGVKTEIIQIDFSEGRNVYEKISANLQNKEIGILVNNVGVIMPYPMIFGEITEDCIWSHVNVNCAAAPALTKLVLPGMLERKRGAIINLASIAARGSVPLLGIYAASKAFVEFFSESLDAEYKDSGIVVQTVTPSYVSSNMTWYSDKVHKPRFFVPTASRFAAHALATLGYSKYTTGYWTHGLMAFIVDNFYPRTMWSISCKLTNENLVQDMRNSKKL
ncbi:Inactive hydroxysteroid dehydrogenase-like protein 1 [Halocaridina rubra]|uniref:Inactive hydroxysteroid dehydrogenase-like protein 1 n=1 Tax=Halocaridina rubra TaxID=373956 RepID=A0AAN9A761_HALRR